MNSTGKNGCLKGRSVIPLILIWAAWFSILAPVPGGAESPAAIPSTPLTVVIDPGHGGGDIGARGPTGLTEKSVNLDLARQLASLLEPQFRVFLTRSDDYAVDLPQRAATANQSKGDLLISIHTGSGFLHRTHGMRIYYYTPVKTAGISRVAEGEAAATQLWRQAQLRHRAASIALAKSLKRSLDTIEQTDVLAIQGAPLKLLEGADLPAVLVEIGHLTHPATEKKLSTPEDIHRIGRALADGVRSFTRKRDADRTPQPLSSP